ncbi:transcriptional regulator [Nocardioides albertanoniae]|uniref:Transcriptional regulator n=1 Tax=Nocardioides albertanoniae TaxID=1175486 RepID=A0A543ACH1_9ACTN|nr:TrmB family transcriptional regulator [Nocardioides albertanoniae]TQL70274.1 transcriptional regulator [Nocardioides albertanoniae]
MSASPEIEFNSPSEPGTTPTLGVTGVSPDEEHIYRLLVSLGATDQKHLSDLMHRSATSPEALEAALERLLERGLVTTHGAPPRYTATAPDVAFGPLLLETQAAVNTASSAISELAEEHRSNARRHNAELLVEVVTGQSALRQALRNIQLSTRTEMLWFCRAGHVAMPSSDNDEEFDMLARGVRYQVLYEHALLEEPGMIDSLVLGVQAGEQARAVAQLPVRMAISDRTIALIPLVPVRDDITEPTAALVRDSNLLTALIALFESYWAAASPLRVGDASTDPTLQVTSPTSPISAADRQLLSLLVAGVSDKAIASRLKVSGRTIQRRVSDLMALTRAQTRMQFAWQVSRRGWLSDQDHDREDQPHPQPRP